MESKSVEPAPPPLSFLARFFLLVGRALLLRCPFCGRGKLFRGWFRMNERCSECGKSFEREPGFFLGSIYFNYGLTALIVAIAYPVLLFGFNVPETPLLVGAAVFVLLCPMLFFRHARSLWLGFDQFADPREQYERPAEEEG
jgi:uncharacterized protein (DUF983 family)